MTIDEEHKQFIRDNTNKTECKQNEIHHTKTLPKDLHKKNQIIKLLYKIKLNELKLMLVKLDRLT